MTRLMFVVLVAGCSHPQKQPPEPIAAAAPAPASAATPTATTSSTDTPAPLYAGMFVDGASFEYELHAYKVDKLGDRHGGAAKHVTCFVRDVLVMHESKALSARLVCDEPGPLNGVMFSTRDGFWWYDLERYTGGGFVMDDSTKVFDREPKVVESSDARLSAVEHEQDGSWCWSESFERTWTSQGLCFADGKLISGWAANQATAKQKGDYLEFRLAK